MKLSFEFVSETTTNRAILRAGREVIVVADHTKCDFVATAFLAPLTSIHTLVTGEKASSGFISALKTQGIDVIVV